MGAEDAAKLARHQRAPPERRVTGTSRVQVSPTGDRHAQPLIPIGTLLPGGLAISGAVSMLVAVYHERRMHRHRQPGVTYGAATFRRDGGWRRADLFTAQGLAHQRRASTFGVLGAILWLLSLASLAFSR